MNKIHRIIWSTAHNAWVVCSEISKARGKSSSTARKLLTAAIILPASALAADNTLPTGGQITAGQGSITQNANTLNIDQHSQNLAADWQSFSIGQDATVNFNQPNSSAVALNRVTGNDPSRILGNLNANGQVFLENGNGIVFGKNARLNVGGLVASTQAISDDGNGTYRIDGSSDAGISNLGNIRAKNGGTVALIASEVDNSGTISAANGNVRLTAAEAVTLKLQDGSLTDYRIERGALDALVDNGGAIIADDGVVHLTAEGKGELRKAAVNHSGKIEANAVSRNDKGEIILLADMQGGTTDVSGSLIADGGGFIEASAATVNITDSADINTGGGTFLIDPYDFVIDSDTSKGNITGNALNGLLANNDVTLQTTINGGADCVSNSNDCQGNDNASGGGNLFVNDAVTWTSDKKLTLEAADSIYINKEIKADNPDAKVALVYGKVTGNADYYLGKGGKITFHDGAGGKQNFSTQKGSAAAIDYTVITALGSPGDETKAAANNSLQGLAESTKLSGKYVIGQDINATATSGWNTNKGFVPIGNSTNAFEGYLHGLGHSITGLTINRPTEDDIGLFGLIDNSLETTVRDIGLEQANITGKWRVGSIAGKLESGTIAFSHASGKVVGEQVVGGLVGEIAHGLDGITHSYADSTIDIINNGLGAGGLVGYNQGIIVDSYATGSVNGTVIVGGLAGGNAGLIGYSYATGNVKGERGVGGLVGLAQAGRIYGTYASGSVTATDSSSDGTAGGLVGIQDGSDTSNSSDILNSYANGSVTGTTVGGLVGYKYDNNSSITDSYWNGDKILTANTCGKLDGSATACDNSLRKSTTELKEPATFTGWDKAKWDIKAGAHPTLKNASTSEAQPSPQFTAPASSTLGTANDNASGELCFAATATHPRKCFSL